MCANPDCDLTVAEHEARLARQLDRGIITQAEYFRAVDALVRPLPYETARS